MNGVVEFPCKCRRIKGTKIVAGSMYCRRCEGFIGFIPHISGIFNRDAFGIGK